MDQHSSNAAEYATQAASVAAKLKAGTWDSVQSLALLSIAESLLAKGATENNPR